jgi:hypothetical protein
MKLFVVRNGTGALILSSVKPIRRKRDGRWCVRTKCGRKRSVDGLGIFILLPKNHPMGENLEREDEPREVLLVAKVGYESLMNIRSCNICVNFEGSWAPGTWVDTKCFECRRMSNFE